MSQLIGEGSSKPAQCPFSNTQLQRITEKNKVLASTGCTKDLCQAGRLIHTDEPRVGENRSVSEVKSEAEEYLRELYREGFYESESAFQDRLSDVLSQISVGTVDGTLRREKVHGKVGGNWIQTPQELEFGVRRAWRNSRKCIMRSHCEELRLCDLRSVTSSTEMATELMKGMEGAFNSGTILPTAFIFPPRSPNKRGPMIWNNALLTFAAYEMENGTILGDPMNIQLTKDIMELGWNPPEPRTRWDLLPLVTMAEDDLPVFVEIPPNLRKLVSIGHPEYCIEFQKLGLKWVAFPALTRLGFDIGGVQYTATPFIGWFMDAEIGVRNLADTFRYHVLPEIVEALSLTKGKLGSGVDSFEDLPEFERLQMLSRAQTELNYAVYWSFLQAKVSMTDTLTASTKYIRYDDEFNEKNGYRLPADPYWLAPPQGSIIPLWHRGGSPNYQPKPMICRHVQDPVKAWRRELQKRLDRAGTPPQTTRTTFAMSRPLSQFDGLSPSKYNPNPDRAVLQISVDNSNEPIKVRETSISIYFCSAGMVAEKLATKLHEKIKSYTNETKGLHLQHKIKPLNVLDLCNLSRDDIILLVVSSTGQGQIPANGTDFVRTCKSLEGTCTHQQDHFRFAVFGNGDSRYSSTYNDAAIKIHQHLQNIGATPLLDNAFPGDTAVEPIPISALNHWWEEIWPKVTGHSPDVLQPVTPTAYTTDAQTRQTQGFATRARELHSSYKGAILMSTSKQVSKGSQGSVRVTFGVGLEVYNDLSCVQVLPVNSAPKVARVLRALHVDNSMEFQTISLGTSRDPTYREFLTEYADLELPFSELKWLEMVGQPLHDTLKVDVFRNMPVVKFLEILDKMEDLHALLNTELRRQICLDMSLLHPRTFSVASSLSYLDEHVSMASEPKFGNMVDILAKVWEGGRFSDIYLTDSLTPSSTKVRFVDSIASKKLPLGFSKPLIILATGAGFGVVRSLLQQRIAAKVNEEAFYGGTTQRNRIPNISIFLGIRSTDFHLVSDILAEAVALDLIDILSIVPSNPKKIRIYEKLQSNSVRQKLKNKLLQREAAVLVCTNPNAAQQTALRLSAIVGEDARGLLGDRYVEEVF